MHRLAEPSDALFSTATDGLSSEHKQDWPCTVIGFESALNDLLHIPCRLPLLNALLAALWLKHEGAKNRESKAGSSRSTCELSAFPVVIRHSRYYSTIHLGQDQLFHSANHSAHETVVRYLNTMKHFVSIKRFGGLHMVLAEKRGCRVALIDPAQVSNPMVAAAFGEIERELDFGIVPNSFSNGQSTGSPSIVLGSLSGSSPAG